MKRILALAILAMLTLIIGAVSAQDESLIPSETYLQFADSGAWQVVDSENGVLTLTNISPRLQYTMTYPRLWSMSLDGIAFIESWTNIGGDIPLEAILSFDVYNVRLLLGAPKVDEATGAVSFEAQVLEVINFVDETRKSIPTSFEFPTLTIQPTLAFTIALMDSANIRLAGTRNTNECIDFYARYVAYRDVYHAMKLNLDENNREGFDDAYFNYITSLHVYMMYCFPMPWLP